MQCISYTSIIVDGVDAVQDAVRSKKFKLVLFDKETNGLNISELATTVKSQNEDTALVLMIDPALEADESDANYVHEIIKNVINKDLLRLVFEKFI